MRKSSVILQCRSWSSLRHPSILQGLNIITSRSMATRQIDLSKKIQTNISKKTQIKYSDEFIQYDRPTYFTFYFWAFNFFKLMANNKQLSILIVETDGFVLCWEILSVTCEKKKANEGGQVLKYNLSKSRLANMMGENPDTFTQEDVNKAIRYLFPSNLASKTAHPSLEHPENIFTYRLEKSWSANRPIHYLYYTGKPLFYAIMHNIYDKILELQKSYDLDQGNKKILPKMNFSNDRWLNKDELQVLVKNEKISLKNYEEFIIQLERLVEEPYVYYATDFLKQYRRDIPAISLLGDITKPQKDENGREYVEDHGQHKTAFSTVKLYSQGSGKITINGNDIYTFFHHIKERQIVLSPLTFFGLLFKFDVEATVKGGHKGIWGLAEVGKQTIKEDMRFPRSAMACSIRYALSRALRSYITKEEIEILRRAGLLTEHIKYKERKRPGLRGARRAPTWKAR